MKIDQEHQIEASEPDADGMYEWYYEYDVYRFREDERTLVARSYTDTNEEAHFLRYEIQAKHLPVTREDLRDPLLQQAIIHLRSIGKARIQYLGPEGYAPLATEA